MLLSGVGIGMETMMCQKAPILRGGCPVRAASTEVVVGATSRGTVASPAATTSAPPACEAAIEAERPLQRLHRHEQERRQAMDAEDSGAQLRLLLLVYAPSDGRRKTGCATWQHEPHERFAALLARS